MRRIFTLFLLAALLSVVGCRKPLAPAIELPAADQIVEMRASAPQIENYAAGPVPEFVVPPEHVRKILFWLSPAEPDRFSVDQGVERGMYSLVADIVIRTKDGRELRLRCHEWGCNPVAFTPNGKDYYLGHSGDEKGEHGQAGIDGGARLYNAIKDAHKAHGK